MKIVIATAVYYPQVNGVAVFSHNLAMGLSERGHEVMVLCPSQTGKTYEVVENGVRTVYLKSVQVKVYPDQIHAVPHGQKFPWYRHGFRVSVFPEFEVRRVLDEFQPDVVHVQVSDVIGLSVVGYARKRGIPVVTTEHNQPEVLTGPLKVPRVLKRGANAVLSAYFRNRQSKSDFVTMPTEQAIVNLLMQGKKELGVPVAAVSNGVDLACFRPGKATREIYEKYGISQEALVVLYVGRVDPEKQVGRVIESYGLALKKLKSICSKSSEAGRDESLEVERSEPSGAEHGESSRTGRMTMKSARPELPVTPVRTELVIVGDGVDKARLLKMVTERGLEGSVKFLGKVLPPDLYELYKVGDVFATASEIETQGIVLIEAAATGLPLIAVDKGAVAEICRTDENGILCKAGNVEEMAEAMVRILTDDDLRSRLAKRSLEIAGEHDFEKTLDKFINIYQRVIDNKTNS